MDARTESNDFIAATHPDAQDTAAPAPAVSSGDPTVYAILFAISLSHLLNDLVQSLIPAIYPILKESFALDFGQVGLITLVFQCTASLLQPVVGFYTDKYPKPFSLSAGMTASLMGLLLLAYAPNYYTVLFAAALVGIGSSIFHPESSRVARMASGGRHGLAQSLFQVGGNGGTALGPLLAAFIVVPHGQRSIAWFSVAAFLAIVVLFFVGRWYRDKLAQMRTRASVSLAEVEQTLSRKHIAFAIFILVLLMFSKQFYLASFNTFYVFYLIDRFQLSVDTAQIYLFVFLMSVVVGVLVGGPIGDKIGRRYVIWASILGVLPFSLMLPYADLFWTGVLSVTVGFILSSATSSIIVYGLELLPGRVGMIAGLFYGLAFGLGGLGAAVLGQVADHTSIDFVYKVCAFLPAIGILTYFLPNTRKRA